MGRETKIWLIVAVVAIAATTLLSLRDRSGEGLSRQKAGGRRVAGGGRAPAAMRADDGIEDPNLTHSHGPQPASRFRDPLISDAEFQISDFNGQGGDSPDSAISQFHNSTTPQPHPSSSREPPIFDKLRKSKDAPIPQAVRDLAEDITKDSTNAVGKARAIYDWLTKNIVYDTAEWESIASGATEYIHDHDPAAVLERGTTVCIGYAWLFDDLCEAAGINATWLIGDVRGYRATPDDSLVTDVRHAWNAVELEDGEWHLLDATWGALQEEESESAISAARADYYFDTPPGQFVFDHLPEDEGWQLLEEAVPSETAFSVLPNLKPSFFTNGLKLGDDYTSVLRAQAGNGAALSFSAPSGTQTAATLGVADDPESFGRIRVAKVPATAATGDNADSGSSLAAMLPSLPAGEYVLRLYSGKAKAGLLECSADFLIKVE